MFGLFGGFDFVFWLIAVVCAVWVIVDILKHQKKMDDTQKIIWILCAIIFNILTAIVYYFVVKKK